MKVHCRISHRKEHQSLSDGDEAQDQFLEKIFEYLEIDLTYVGHRMVLERFHSPLFRQR